MDVKVSWKGGMSFEGTNEHGQSVTMDGDQPGSGVSPMENVLMSLGGCSSVDVVMILEKARQKVKDCVVSIHGERVDDIPRVFKEIHICFSVYGEDIAEHHVKRAVSLSMEKYCSVSKMLDASVKIKAEYKIFNTASD